MFDRLKVGGLKIGAASSKQRCDIYKPFGEMGVLLPSTTFAGERYLSLQEIGEQSNEWGRLNILTDLVRDGDDVD